MIIFEKGYVQWDRQLSSAYINNVFTSACVGCIDNGKQSLTLTGLNFFFFFLWRPSEVSTNDAVPTLSNHLFDLRMCMVCLEQAMHVWVRRGKEPSSVYLCTYRHAIMNT